MNKEYPLVRGDPPVAADPDALPNRKELSLVAFERTRMPIVITNARNGNDSIVLANQSFLDLTGYRADEVLGRNCRFLQGPGTDASALDEIRQGLRETRDISVEMLNYRKDGSTFWNQLEISPVLDENGTVIYHFASQRDVSERRRAQEMEAAERLLLMEVDHRAMNALALVQSIVRLSKSDTVENYASSIQGRVDSLARAHRLLGEIGWAGATLSELLALEAASHIDRLVIEGPPIFLPARLVQPIALVIHELLSNALAHGALSTGQGHLRINWQQSADVILFTWRETGAPMPIIDDSPGFGLAIIKGVIQNQLRGNASINWKKDGMEALLKFQWQ
mgnify:CR=1 FL=1